MSSLWVLPFEPSSKPPAGVSHLPGAPGGPCTQRVLPLVSACTARSTSPGRRAAGGPRGTSGGKAGGSCLAPAHPLRSSAFHTYQASKAAQQMVLLWMKTRDKKLNYWTVSTRQRTSQVCNWPLSEYCLKRQCLGHLFFISLSFLE